ncbi:MAG: hypothetical protein RLY21_171 [Planctomycetota bacterium]
MNRTCTADGAENGSGRAWHEFLDSLKIVRARW